MDDPLKFPNEVWFMIFTQFMLAELPRIIQLKRKKSITTGIDDIAFYGNITQPFLTYFSHLSRDWAREHYVLAFASPANDGELSVGLWIHRTMDLVYIDNAFCALRLHTIRHIDMSCVTRLAIDATLLNNVTGRDVFSSPIDELLTYFSNAQNMVFMVPTRPNPPRNRYRGLRLVDEQEDEDQKEMAFTNFYHCGRVGINMFHTAILFFRSAEAMSGTVIRTRLPASDKLRRAIPSQVVLFQREGMRSPTRNIVTGPRRYTNNALSKISYRMHPEHISMPQLLELLE